MSSSLKSEEIMAHLESLNGWTYQDDSISREFSFSDFKEAMAFLISVAFASEAANHHPEIYNVYNRVTLRLSTHDAGDKVTHKDLDLATLIDSLYSE